MVEERISYSMERTSRWGKKRFTLPERKFLMELVSQYAHVVDSPEVDSSSLQEKRSVWLHVKEVFNSFKTHNPRSVKQLKKAWENHKTKIKKMNMKPQDNEELINICDEESASKEEEFLAKKRARDPESNLVGTKNNLIGATQKSEDPDILTCEVNQKPLPEMINSPSYKKEVRVSNHPPPPTKITLTTSSALPRQRCTPNNVKINKRFRGLNVQVGCDEEMIKLMKREMLINVEIEELEKKKVEVELKMKEEELSYKKIMWELEIKLLKKKLYE